MSDLGTGYPSHPVVGERRQPTPPPPSDPPPPPVVTPKAAPAEDVTKLVKQTGAERVENAMMTYVIPLVAGGFLMSTCYGLGKFGYSIGWIGFFVALNFLKSKLWRKREKRVLALRQAATREREVIMAQLQDLPAWVQFPDTERVEWINKVIHQLWPYIGEYTKTFIAEFVEPQVKASLPGMFKSFRFEEIDMGDLPLRVGGIKVYTENVGRDRIIMDMDVAYAGDCNFVVAVGAFRGGLNQMQFKGKLRCILKPLLAYPPMVGGVTAFFLDDPTIDFNLTGLGEMVEIPGLFNAIRSVVTAQVRSICVLPNEIVVPLTAETDVARLHFPEPDGIIRIGVLEARDLENLDMTFIKKGKSDPYARIAVGAQHFKTEVVDDNLNPRWDEWFEAVVDQASGQKLLVEVFDEDAGKDEELGHLTLDLDTIRRKGVSDTWYQLEGAKQGELRLKLVWMNLSTEPETLNKNNWEKEWRDSKNPLHPAMLMTYIDCVSNLPFPKRNLEPSPYVEIRVGKEKRKTYPKPKTANPLYQHKELFFVNDPENQNIVIEAFDDGTKRSLGEMTVRMEQLLRQPEMEMYQQTFMLTLGAQSSPLVATFRLRGFEAKRTSEFVEPPPPSKVTAASIRKTPEVAVEKREALSPRAVKRGDKERRPTRHHSDSRPLADKPPRRPRSPTPPALPTRHQSEMVLTHSGGNLDDGRKVKNGGSLAQLGKGDAAVMKSPSLMLTSDSDRPRSRASSILSLGSKKKHLKRNKSFTGSKAGDVGRLEMSLRYSFQTDKLVVSIIRCEGLRSMSTDDVADPYVKVRLLKENTAKEEFKTRIAIGTLNPEFQQTFTFDLHHKDLSGYSLFLKVKDGASYGLFTKPPILGKFLYPLSQLDPNHEITEMFDLSF